MSGTIVVDCAVKMHRRLGPGLLERVYETVLCYELESRGLSFQRQVPIPISYDNLVFAEGFRADIVVDDKVILELKSVEHVTKAHKKQLLTYLRVKSRLIIYTLFEDLGVIFLPLFEGLYRRHVTNRLLRYGVIVDANVVLDSGLEFEC